MRNLPASLPAARSPILAALLIALCPWATLASAELPELPRIYVDTSLVIPTGAAIVVPDGGDLQQALNVAQPGDVILLEAGAVYQGPFTLPRKTGDGWIAVVSSRVLRVCSRSTRAALRCAEDGGSRRGAALGVADGARRSPLPVRGPGDAACGGHVHVQHRGRGQRCAQPRRHPAPRDLRSVLSPR